MAALVHMKKESIYVPAGYRENFTRHKFNHLMRIREIRNNEKQYKGYVNTYELQKAIKILKGQYKLVKIEHNQHIHFFKIYRLITLYTTFIMDKPVHSVEMPFPEGLKIKHEDGICYCPVKESQKDNPELFVGSV